MELSALLLLGAFASACAAQAPSTQTAPPRLLPDVIDDQVLSQASAAMGVLARSRQAKAMIDQINQANCPVVLTSAWLAPRLQLLTSGDTSGGNGIDLEFRNTSGKEIRSIELSATILVKKSIYDLGYLPPVHLDLTANGTRNIDSAFADLRRLSLPSQMHPAVVDGLRVEQVAFEDGSVWSPSTNQFCGLKPDSMRSIGR